MKNYQTYFTSNTNALRNSKRFKRPCVHIEYLINISKTRVSSYKNVKYKHALR